jgi:hypothetical protein
MSQMRLKGEEENLVLEVGVERVKVYLFLLMMTRWAVNPARGANVLILII